MNRSDSALNAIVMMTISHKTAPYSVIGELERLEKKAYQALSSIVNEIVILSTCNRFEVYAETGDHRGFIEGLKELLQDKFKYARILKGREAAEHLFRVAAGLESAILGENEILGQVRRAWLSALEQG